MADRDRDPDAFIVIHTPKGGGDPYGVGPFPPIDDLADGLLAHPTCSCDLKILWIGFPTGIVMALSIDEDKIAEMIKHIDEVAEELARDQTTDLLN